MEFKAVRLELAKTTIIVDAETQSKTIAVMAEGKDTEKNALLFENAPEMLEMLKILIYDYKNYTQNILQDSHRLNRINEIEQLIKQAT